MRVGRIAILPTTPPLGSRWVDICVISYSEGVLIDVMWEAVDELDQLWNLQLECGDQRWDEEVYDFEEQFCQSP